MSNIDFRIALVCMPFFMSMRPSIQIGLLHALAEQAGFNPISYHLNLDLAKRIGISIYDQLCVNHRYQVGEWLFSISAFGNNIYSDDESYLSAFPDVISWAEGIGKNTSYLAELRHVILPEYIYDCAEMVDWGRYHIVGFTSTFQQHVASLALARLIKERYPDVKIIFGGANMQGEMGCEHIRAFPFIDYAVIGEADYVFPKLLVSLANDTEISSLPGLLVRNGNVVSNHGEPQPFLDLNNLPTPNYDEYFKRASTLSIICETSSYANDVNIPFESSRGCWWGQKHQCTFCGLNGHNISFRSKSPSKVLTELSELSRKYRITFFEAMDNILDMSYLSSFFSVISENKIDYQFFYEVKSTLTRNEIKILRQGGVKCLQPGIESLSSHVLQLMQKGSTMLQNVRFLKWCHYYKIRVAWNLLWGFPGETELDYENQLDIIKTITHLEPPLCCGRFWLERFSKYFTHNEYLTVFDYNPHSFYKYIYPLSVSADKIAYYFDYSIVNALTEDIYSETSNMIKEWQLTWHSNQQHTLYYRKTSGSLFVDDNRDPKQQGTFAFYGPMAKIYELCSETMHTVHQVTEYLQSLPEKYAYTKEEVQWALEQFCRMRIMITESGNYLSLALPVNPNW